MNIKRLVLGTAAGALAVTGAQAADLPVVVEPVDYVRICDAFGVGFYYIPGTETCLRVSGRIRADYNVFFDTDSDNFDVAPGVGWDNNFQNGYRFRARAYIYLDSRTNTEFGLLRTFTEVYFTSNFGAGTSPQLQTELNRAFIQFGGLTFGRTQSFYDFGDTYYTAGQFFDVGISDTTTNVLAYTFAFGNGFSASISLEDETPRRGGVIGVYGPGGGPFFFDSAPYQGTRIPDIVGNVRVDQGWGSAQIMAAGHYTDVQGRFGFDDNYGFAVGGGVSVNVPFGNGTKVGLQAAYSHGATKYASAAGGAEVSNTGILLPGGGVYFPGSVDLYADGTIDASGNLDLSDAFSIQGGFSTNFTPTISLAGSIAYLYIDHSDLAILDPAGGVTQYDLDNQTWNVQGFLGYTPVSGMTFGLGAEYRYVDTEDFGSGSALSTFFRAQRTF
jgi:hypothetical protein